MIQLLNKKIFSLFGSRKKSDVRENNEANESNEQEIKFKYDDFKKLLKKIHTKKLKNGRNIAETNNSSSFHFAYCINTNRSRFLEKNT